jgi:hypothetical protein
VKKVEPWLNYLRFCPIYLAKVHLTASDTMNLGVSHEKTSQLLLAERWWLLLRSGDPCREGPHFEMG